MRAVPEIKRTVREEASLPQGPEALWNAARARARVPTVLNSHWLNLSHMLLISHIPHVAQGLGALWVDNPSMGCGV